jgi:hypothetical protein
MLPQLRHLWCTNHNYKLLWKVILIGLYPRLYPQLSEVTSAIEVERITTAQTAQLCRLQASKCG